MPTPRPRQPQPAPLPPGSPRHSRSVTPARPDDSGGTSGTASSSRAPSQALLQQRLQGAFLTVIGIAGLIGGVLFSIEAPRFTPVPVVFLTFWLVMVIVGKILFAGLGKLREAGVGAPAPSQVRAAAAVAGIVVAVGMMGFATTTAGTGTAIAAPCPGGGPATCGPTGPELTFTPPPAQTGAPGGQQGDQQGGQDNNGIATSPSRGGGDNGPGIQAQTPQFGTPGQQAPNIPGNEPPGQGSQQGQQPQGNGQGQQNQNPTVRTTAPGGPQQSGQQPGQQTQSGQPSSPTVTVTKTESQCTVPGAGNGAGTAGSPGSGDSNNDGGGTGPDNGGDGEQKDGAPSWAYLVGEVTALMTGRRGRKAGPLNKDGSAPTNKMIPGDQIDGDNYKQWTTPDGDRTYILSENKDAPSQYRFALNQPPGGSSKVNDDGSVSVFDRDGNQVNRFDTPWAYDSVTGEKIATRYSVDGDDLVQTIDRPEGNNNPILADPNPDGTPTPEEAAAADKIRELAAQGNPIAQQMAQSLQPPMPDMATEIGKGIDQAEQAQIQAPLMSAVNQATQQQANSDPAKLLDDALNEQTQTEQSAISELQGLVSRARQDILQNKVIPARAEYQRLLDQANSDADSAKRMAGVVEAARQRLAEALGEYAALPDISGVSRMDVDALPGGKFVFNRSGEKPVTVTASPDGTIKATEQLPEGFLDTLFKPDGTHETRFMSQGNVEAIYTKPLDFALNVIPFGKGLGAGARIGLGRVLTKEAGEATAETVDQAMLRAATKVEQDAIAKGKSGAAQITKNRAAGLEAGEWLARNQYPGAAVDSVTYKIPGLGPRRIDVFHPTGKAIEVKTGYTDYAGDVIAQVAKDKALQNGAVQDFTGTVEWVFFKSIFTGKGGPSPELQKQLGLAGINWKVM